MHLGFYLLIAALPVTGLATAVIAHLNDIVFAHSGDPLPPDLHVFPTRVVHGWLGFTLLAMIVWHLVIAAPRLARMKLGRRRGNGERIGREARAN